MLEQGANSGNDGSSPVAAASSSGHNLGVPARKGMHRRQGSGDLSTVVFDVPCPAPADGARRRKGSNSSEAKGEHVTKKVRKQQKSIKKNTEKLAAAEHKAPTKRALRRTKAEFGCPNAKLARLWVDAIRDAIENENSGKTQRGSDQPRTPPALNRIRDAELNNLNPKSRVRRPMGIGITLGPLRAPNRERGVPGRPACCACGRPCSVYGTGKLILPSCACVCCSWCSGRPQGRCPRTSTVTSHT